MSGCINIIKIYRNDESYKLYLKLEYIEDTSKVCIHKERDNYLDWSYYDYFQYDPCNIHEIHEAFTDVLSVIYRDKLMIENIKAFEKILRRVYEQYGHDYYWNSRSNVNNADYSNKH